MTDRYTVRTIKTVKESTSPKTLDIITYENRPYLFRKPGKTK